MKVNTALPDQFLHNYTVNFDSLDKASSCAHSNGENPYVPNPTYATTVQKYDRFIRYREDTYMWMVRICQNKRFSPNVAYIGMNFFDRYLSLVYVDRRRIELLSWCCLHLASVTAETRSSCLSIKQISKVVSDTFSIQSITQMVEEILCVLQFALYPSSPYSIGKQILCESGNERLLSQLYCLLNGVCMNFSSIRYCPKSIAYTCLLLIWFYSYEDKDLPPSMTICRSVYVADAMGILPIVRDSFPMLDNACHLTETELTRSCCSSRSSPTAIL